MEKKYEFFVRFSDNAGLVRETIIDNECYYMTEDSTNINFISFDKEQFFSYNKKFIVSHGKRLLSEPKELDVPF